MADTGAASAYLQRHHVAEYVTELTRHLLHCGTEDSALQLAASWLTAIAQGNVAGQPFRFVSATARNRRALVALAHRAVASAAVAAPAPLTAQDLHSLLLLLCPDLLARVLNSALKASTRVPPAAAAQAACLPGTCSGASSSEAQSTEVLQLLSSLEVTFLYEHYFLDLRRVAFAGRSHTPQPATAVERALPAVGAAAQVAGWEAPPQALVHAALVQCTAQAQAAEPAACGAAGEGSGGDKRVVQFHSLVRMLCTSVALAAHLSESRRTCVALLTKLGPC